MEIIIFLSCIFNRIPYKNKTERKEIYEQTLAIYERDLNKGIMCNYSIKYELFLCYVIKRNFFVDYSRYGCKIIKVLLVELYKQKPAYRLDNDAWWIEDSYAQNMQKRIDALKEAIKLCN